MATQKPDTHARIGNVEAAIWRNENGGRFWYNVTFKQHYKEGDVWKSTESFRRDELVVLAKVADSPHTLILDLQAGDGEALEEV